MGTLFDGYAATRSGRKRRRAARPWDEMFPADAATVAREPYREIYPALARMTQEELRGRTEALASSYLAQGVTFDFAGEERPFPLDAVPRVIEQAEWTHVEAGVKQRVRALEAFLADVYGAAARRARRRDPARGSSARRATSTAQAAGIVSRERRAHPRLRHRPHPRRAGRLARARRQRARAVRRQLRHLEPAGDGADAARALRRRCACARSATTRSRLLGACARRAPEGVDDPTVVVLTPGVYNSAYFEHTLLARLMGVELVEGRDLFCSGGRVWMRTTAGPTRVDVIYRRVDDEFLDPLQFRADSMLGSPGPHARRAPRQRHDRQRRRQRRRRRQARLHLPARPDPLLPRRGADPPQRRHLAARGAGRARGGARPARRARREARRRLRRQGPRRRSGRVRRRARRAAHAGCAADPRGWIAQPVVQLSTHPDARRGRDAPAARRPAAVRRQRRQRTCGCCPAGSPASRCPRASSSSTPARAAARRTRGCSDRRRDRADPVDRRATSGASVADQAAGRGAVAHPDRSTGAPHPQDQSPQDEDARHDSSSSNSSSSRHAGGGARC